MHDIKSIGVIGAGQMGNGIAQVAAVSGFDVVLSDIEQDALDRATTSIAKSLSKFVSKGKLSEESKVQALGRISTSLELEQVAQSDLVVEAAVEREEVKLSIFEKLDTYAPKHTILASNTSSISITRIAAATMRPHKVIGMHFMNPVPIMKLVEIICGLATDEATYAAVASASEAMGKTTVVAQDYAGFIVNRVLMPMINEAVYTLMEGVGSVEDIDTAMKLGTNQPMGPLTLADFIGLDTCLAIMNVLHDSLGDSKYRACPLLRKYVDAGWLGRKSGQGFYNYNNT